jgi:hypothetical protein
MSKRTSETPPPDVPEKKQARSSTCGICEAPSCDLKQLHFCLTCVCAGTLLRFGLYKGRDPYHHVHSCTTCTKIDVPGTTRGICKTCEDAYIAKIIKSARKVASRRIELTQGHCTGCNRENRQVVSVTGKDFALCVTCLQSVARYPADVNVCDMSESDDDVSGSGDEGDEGDEGDDSSADEEFYDGREDALDQIASDHEAVQAEEGEGEDEGDPAEDFDQARLRPSTPTAAVSAAIAVSAAALSATALTGVVGPVVGAAIMSVAKP